MFSLAIPNNPGLVEVTQAHQVAFVDEYTNSVNYSRVAEATIGRYDPIARGPLDRVDALGLEDQREYDHEEIKAYEFHKNPQGDEAGYEVLGGMNRHLYEACACDTKER